MYNKNNFYKINGLGLLIRGVHQLLSNQPSITKTLKQEYQPTLHVLYCTFTFSCYSVSIIMGGAGPQTCPSMQSGLGVQTGITVIAVRPVTQSAVRVATQTLPLLFVFKEPLGTV